MKKLIFCIGVACAGALILLSASKCRAANEKVTVFKAVKLNAEVKERISGVSYKKNSHITYDDLRYVTVLYYNFDGKVKKGELIVNKKIAAKVVKIFSELYDIKYPIQKMRLIDYYGGDDDVSMKVNNSSAFNYRNVDGTKKLSNHALGMAVDINPKMNPYVRVGKVLPANGKAYTNRNPKTCKGKEADKMILPNSKIVKIFKKYGFTWGGDWKNSKDYQHFEYPSAGQ